MSDTTPNKDKSVQDSPKERLTLDYLMKSFDPTKHRYTREERWWDDKPVGKELI